jgi:hypothetical protein
MAEAAADKFDTWFTQANQELGPTQIDPLASVYQEWLREGGGLAAVANDYGLAVETLLVVITTHASADLPLASAADNQAWDFMTETGFRYEVFHYKR